MFNVGAQLRKHRRRSNLTLDQLAASSGVDRGTISRIELGHVSPRIDTISFLCEAMGTNLAQFFGFEASGGESEASAPGRGPGAEAPGPAEAGSVTGGALLALPGSPARVEIEGYWPVPSSFWHGLLEVLDRFEGLLKNSSELILVQDRAGLILYASPSCESILGLRSPELVGKPSQALIHPADLPRVEGLLAVLMPVANATGRLDFRLRNKNGSWRWAAARFSNQCGNPSIQAVVINALESSGPVPA
jgi:PAS domain S-box-containing protein